VVFLLTFLLLLVAAAQVNSVVEAVLVVIAHLQEHQVQIVQRNPH
jgi:hypothetical protein